VCALVVLLALAAEVARGANDLPRLPDGETSRWGDFSAYLIDPTTRYRHGVLGDGIEAAGFAVEEGHGRRLIYRLGDDAVFEDRRVRLVDLDGDRRPEAMVVKSYLSRGSALAIYALRGDLIEPIAESTPIGAPHRWLNPVGAANFVGTGETTIAAVITPHLAGSLRLFRLSGGALTEIARIDGVTNHIIGTRNLDLARIDDADGDGVPDIVLPSLDRHALAAVSFRGGKGVVIRSKRVQGRVLALESSHKGKVVVLLENGHRTVIDLNAP
jgi:hypothetical protein